VTPGTPWEPELDRLGARLDAEVRAERAAYEAEALRGERRARRLADLARALVERGDVVEVRAGRRAVAGVVVHAARDLLVLEVGVAGATVERVDVALAAVTSLRLVERRLDGGRAPATSPATLRARMTEHEVAGAVLDVVLVDGEEVTGVVAAAAEDHLLLEGRDGWAALPWPAVALARPAT
jgi:hypothetical protein